MTNEVGNELEAGLFLSKDTVRSDNSDHSTGVNYAVSLQIVSH